MQLRCVEQIGDIAVLTYLLQRSDRPKRVADSDHDWLIQAIKLSERCVPSQGAFSVGAIIVDRNGRFIASAYSREVDAGDHAEETAIAKALRQGHDLHRSTIYSSLEPCSTRLSGKRSCTQRIVDAGIGRVVFAYREPDTFVKCEGCGVLVAHGVQVVQLQEYASLVEEVNRHLLKGQS
jgi:pyrimidine deaminase RibD-like protein